VILALTALALASPFTDYVATLPDAPVVEVVGDYRFAAEDFGAVARAMAAHPGVAEAEQIGVTTAGVPVWAFHVRPAHPTRSVLVFAGIHAMEWISTEVATDLLVEAIAVPPPDVALTVIPLLNPDGRAKVERDLRGGHTRVYRRGNGPNVDLNRDFAVNRVARTPFRHVIPGYYETSPGALSQPESRALVALVGRERYTRAASLHAFGGYFYYPWSGRWRRPEDRADFITLGRAMEVAQGRRAYRTRQLSHWAFFFRAQGSEIDHLYGKYGTHAFLVELTRGGVRAGHLWRDAKTPFRWYNPVRRSRQVNRGLQAMRALVDTPTLLGEREVTPPETLPPQEARRRHASRRHRRETP